MYIILIRVFGSMQMDLPLLLFQLQTEEFAKENNPKQLVFDNTPLQRFWNERVDLQLSYVYYGTEAGLKTCVSGTTKRQFYRGMDQTTAILLIFPTKAVFGDNFNGSAIPLGVPYG